MNEKKTDLTRRDFIITGSAAVAASPLIAKGAGVVPSISSSRQRNESASTRTTSQNDRIRNVIYYINRGCVGCQTCRALCPQKAVRFGDCRNEIIQEKCNSCGVCYIECPISIISEAPIE